MIEVVAVIRCHGIRMQHKTCSGAVYAACDLTGERAPGRGRGGADDVTAKGQYDVPAPGGHRGRVRGERAAEWIRAGAGVDPPGPQRIAEVGGVSRLEPYLVRIEGRVVREFVAGAYADRCREQSQDADGCQRFHRSGPDVDGTEGGSEGKPASAVPRPATTGVLARSAQSRCTWTWVPPWAIRVAP